MPPPPLRQKRSRAERRAVAPAALVENYVVAGKYRLAERIGTGSMGSVWRADHVMLGNSVAIKFMHASVDAYPEGRVRFEREAMLSARLGEACPHICKVVDYGVLDSTMPFVVMELLRGEELLTRLKREQRLSLPETVRIVRQLCKALTVAHAAGVVHRDLKPANVFLCSAEDSDEVLVKLLDFGVAKAGLEHEETQGTSAGTIFGTPGYMSPEQIVADAAIDLRADLWSVVVLAYRMVVGKTPFGSGNLRELGMRILSSEAPVPSEIQSDIPRAFDEWVRKGLSKRREERFATATELAAALESVAQGAPAVVPITPSEVPRHSETDDRTYDAISRSALPPGPPSRWRRAAPYVALAGGAVLVAVALLTRQGDAPKVESDKSALASPVDTAEPSGDRPANEQPRPPKPEAEPATESPAASAGAAPPEPEVDTPLPDETTPAVVAEAPKPEPAAPARAKAPPRKARTPAKAPTSNIEERAAALWNKKDEL